MNDTIVIIRPLEARDFGTLTTVARTIWFAHFATMISPEQIEYMVGGRFTPENLRRYLGSNERWLDVIERDGEIVGYCSYALTSAPDEMKLEQLYLLPRLHGQGLGKRMLDHIERRALAQGHRSLMLTVNKGNEKAINVYHRTGFTIREGVVMDIGGGFVMDDYVMSKRL